MECNDEICLPSRAVWCIAAAVLLLQPLISSWSAVFLTLWFIRLFWNCYHFLMIVFGVFRECLCLISIDRFEPAFAVILSFSAKQHCSFAQGQTWSPSSPTFASVLITSLTLQQTSTHNMPLVFVTG